MSYKRVSGAKTRKVATHNSPNGDLGGFYHGDLSPRQAKIRQTEAENATHGMSRTFVWRVEKSPCENTKKSPFGGFSRGDLSPRQAKIRHIYKLRVFAFHQSCFRLAGRQVAMRKHEESHISCFRPFSFLFNNCSTRIFTTDGRRKLATYKCVVSSPGGAKGRHAKTRQMAILAGFRVATFRPARQRYGKQKAKRRRMKSVVLLRGGAKGRHAKTRKSNHLAVVAWRFFAFSPRKHDNTTWHKSSATIV